MVTMYDSLNTQVVEQDERVERLQAEKSVLFHKVQQEGFELGIRSTSKLSYQNFKHFERVSPLAQALDDEVLDYLWMFLDQQGYPEVARLHDPDFAHLLEVSPQSRILFVQGWLDGVLSVWETIKGQVESEQ